MKPANALFSFFLIILAAGGMAMNPPTPEEVEAQQQIQSLRTVFSLDDGVADFLQKRLQDDAVGQFIIHDKRSFLGYRLVLLTQRSTVLMGDSMHCLDSRSGMRKTFQTVSAGNV